MTTTDPAPIGARIRAERDRLGWSQMDLAVKADSTPSAICKIELGDSGVGVALGRRIANAFGWSLDYLFNGTETKGRSK